MDFGGNFLFQFIPIIFGIIGLAFYVGIFVLIVLGIIYLYKKIQNETQVDRIVKDLQEIKLKLSNIQKKNEE